jgi:hypothetical protein
MRTQSPKCWCLRCRARRRRPYVIALFLVIVAAIFLVHSHPEPQRTQPARAPAARTARPRTPQQPSAETAGSSVATAGQDLNWVSFHGMQLPASATAGPRDTRSGLASGFADTPRGALLAAINIGVRTAAQWGTAIFAPTITSQVTGPDARTLLEAEETSYAQLRAAAQVAPGQPAGQGYAAEMAYRFLAWSPASAVVDVVSAEPVADGTTALASTRIQVLWQHDDWRVVAPPGGNWANAATAISSLTGYTPFPGER